MRKIPRECWPSLDPDRLRLRICVWDDLDYIVQAFEVPNHPGVVRLTINRKRHDGPDGIGGFRWLDGITWDEIQQLKQQCGYGDSWAVEVFPPDDQVVNVANMRHVWVLPDAPTFAWRKPTDRTGQSPATNRENP